MPQTATQIQTELNRWYAARTAAVDGKTFNITTSAGTRILSYQNIEEINVMIDRLERQLAGAGSTTNKQGLHDFALANMGDNEANR